MFERRLRGVAAGGALFLFLLLAVLFRMQVVNADRWRREARELGYRSIVLKARRGPILDRNGTPLAEDRLQWDLVVRFDEYDGTAWTCEGCGRTVRSPGSKAPRRCAGCGTREFAPRPARDLSRLPALLGIPAAELEGALARARGKFDDRVDREMKKRLAQKLRAERAAEEQQFSGWWWRVVENVPREVVKEVDLHPDRYRGLSIDPEWRRMLLEPSAASIVGRVGPVWQEEVKGLLDRGYSYARIYRTVLGRSGLEMALEDRLAAREGARRVYRNLDGDLVTLPGEVPARDGETIRTSLDLALEKRTEEALARAGRSADAAYGAFVALEVDTGDVLAVASWSKEKTELFYPVQRMVPGSVFKVVTAIAGLESGAVPAGHRFDCDGSWHGIRCHHPARNGLDVVEALCCSCNGFFADAAGEMGIVVLDDWANRLGFEQPTGIELPGEKRGLIPDPEWKARAHERNPTAYPYRIFLPGETWNAGFGQGAVLVTPLQVARLMAIVGNGGLFVRPTLVAGEGGTGDRVVSPATIRLVRRGLEAVVARGTGERTGLSRFGVAGKTGTAELLTKQSNAAWFAGYAPAEAPRVAFACVLARTKDFGADAAGPVVSEFLEGYFAR